MTGKDNYDHFVAYLDWRNTCQDMIVSNNYINAIGVARTIAAMKGCMTGPAKKMILNIETSQMKSVEAFFEKIGQHFAGNNVKEHALAMYRKCVQGKDDLNIYPNKLLMLRNAAIAPEERHESDIIRQFIVGLNDNRVSAKINLKDEMPTTFDEVVKLAIKYTAQIECHLQLRQEHFALSSGKGQTKGQGQTKGKNVSSVSMQNVAKKNEGGKKNANANSGQPAKNANNGQQTQTKGQGQDSQTKPKVNCYKCGLSGHISMQCKASEEVVKAYQAKKDKEKANSPANVANAQANNGAKPKNFQNKGKGKGKSGKKTVHNVQESDDTDWIGCSVIQYDENNNWSLDDDAYVGALDEVNGNTSSPQVFLNAEIQHAQANVAVRVLVDTGNRSTSLINMKTFRSLCGGTTPTDILTPIDTKLYAAGQNQQLNVLGRMPEVTMVFEDLEGNQVRYKVRPLVVSNLQLPCILSYKDMVTLKMVVDMGNQEVIINQVKPPVVLPLVAYPKDNVADVYLPKKLVEIGRAHV